jgi:hypothetical protein
MKLKGLFGFIVSGFSYPRFADKILLHIELATSRMK